MDGECYYSSKTLFFLTVNSTHTPDPNLNKSWTAETLDSPHVELLGACPGP